MYGMKREWAVRVKCELASLIRSQWSQLSDLMNQRKSFLIAFYQRERERELHLGIYWWISFSCFLDYSYCIEAFLCLKLCRWTVLARYWSDSQCIFLSCWAYKHITDENKWQYFVNNEMVAIYRASQMSSYMHWLDIIASLVLLCKIHKTLLSDIWYALVSHITSLHWMQIDISLFLLLGVNCCETWLVWLCTIGCKLLSDL